MPTAPGAEQVALDNIATESAIALLSRLPEQQANVILLRVVAGLDTDVIAEMLGTSAGAVRVAAHRGLRKLETLLTGPGVTSRAGCNELLGNGVPDGDMPDSQPPPPWGLAYDERDLDALLSGETRASRPR